MSARPVRPSRPAGPGGAARSARRAAARKGQALALATALLVPGTVAGVLVGGAGTAQAALDTTLYAVAQTVLYRVDENTGAATAMPGTLPFTTNAAARQPGSNLIWYTEGAAAGRVGTYDVVTHETEVLPGTVGASFTRLAFRSDGRLFGMVSNALYELDTTTGASLGSRVVAGLPTSGGGDMAFTPDGDAYVVVGSALFHLDEPYTTATSVGALGSTKSFPSLAFGASGRLWAAGNANGELLSDVGYLSTQTGAFTRLSTTSGFTFSDMASAPNRKPVITGTAHATTTYGTPASVDVTPLLSDPDGDPMTVVAVDGKGFGTGSVDAAGRAVFTGRPGFSGLATITYSVSDGLGGLTVGDLEVLVGNATPAFTTAAANTAQTISRGATPAPLVAQDPNPEALTYRLSAGQLPPGVVLQDDGTFRGPATTAGTWTAAVEATDPQGAAAQTTVTITVTPNAPAFTAAPTNTAQTVLRGATPAPVVAEDPDGDPLTYEVTGGTLPDGVELTPTGAFTGSPGARGSWTVTVTVRDDEEASDTTDLVITVPNTAPVFSDDPANTAQTLVQGDTPAPLEATDDDGDPVTHSVRVGDLPPGVALQPSGTFTGTADVAGSYGVEVVADDGQGGRTVRTLRLQVNAAGAPRPDEDSATTPAGSAVLTDVLDGDEDPAGYPLRVTGAGEAAHGTVTVVPGGVRYVPDTGFSGDDSYTYDVSNGRGGSARGTVVVTVTPVAADDEATTTGTDPVPVDVLANDLGTVDPAAVAVLAQPAHGTVAPGEDGTLVYTAALGFTGPDTFTYEVTDGAGRPARANVTVVVERPGAPGLKPLRSEGVGTALQEGLPDVSVGGTLVLVDGDRPVPALTVAGQGTWTVDGSRIVFAPVPGLAGPATIVTYRVTDAYGQSAEQTYSATVLAPAAPAPTGESSTGTGTAPQSAELDVPAQGSAALLEDGRPVAALTTAQGTWVLEGGTITFTPVLGFAGDATVRFRLTDSWGQSGEAAYVATVRRPAAPVADPVASTGTGTATQSSTLPVPPGGSVRLLDADDLPVMSLTVEGQGSYALDPVSGVVLFTPVLGFAGSATPVRYAVTDAYGQTTAGRYAATVAAPPAPAPTPLTTTGTGGQTTTVAVPEGGTVVLLDGGVPVTTLTVPGEGTYVVDPVTGRITFTPVPGFTGTASAVGYRVVDAYGSATDATYTATVTALPVVPPAPGPDAPEPDVPDADAPVAQAPAGASPTRPVPDGGGVPVSVPAGTGVPGGDAQQQAGLLGGLLLTVAGAVGLRRRPRRQG